MLNELIIQRNWIGIFFAIAVPLLLLTTSYVRCNGIATLLVQNMSISLIHLMLAVVLFITTLLSGFALFFCFLISFLLLRYFMQQRLGSTTGDTIGAMIELIETSLLITAAII